MNIDEKIFFRVGGWCFLIIAIMSFINYLIGFDFMTLPSKVSSAAGIFFNFIASMFFFSLLRRLQPSTEQESPEIDQIIKEFKHGRPKRKR